MSDLEPIPTPSRWARYHLMYVPPYASHSMRAFLVFRRIDDGAAFEDAEFRVWCEELVQGTLWWNVEAAPEDARVLRILFPADCYEGMATHVDVEVPPVPKAGSIWRLRAPHNKDPELFRLESTTEVTDSGLAAEERSMQALRFSPTGVNFS